MSKFIAPVKKLFVEEEGAALAEYGLLLALIAVVCIAAVTLVGTNVKTTFNTIAGAL